MSFSRMGFAWNAKGGDGVFKYLHISVGIMPGRGDMKEIVDVQIGEVKASKEEVVLTSKAIGSCVAVVAYDATKGVGGIAHIMLPGAAPVNRDSIEKTKYAADAIETLLARMAQLGSNNGDIRVALVGGGNVLDRADDTICRDNLDSTLEFLLRNNLAVTAKAVGGTSRRSVSLDVKEGVVFYTEGNGVERRLWSANKRAEH